MSRVRGFFCGRLLLRKLLPPSTAKNSVDRSARRAIVSAATLARENDESPHVHSQDSMGPPALTFGNLSADASFDGWWSEFLRVVPGASPILSILVLMWTCQCNFFVAVNTTTIGWSCYSWNKIRPLFAVTGMGSGDMCNKISISISISIYIFILFLNIILFIYIYIFVFCMYVYMYIYIVFFDLYLYMYIYICVCVYMYIYGCICTYLCVWCACMYSWLWRV